MQQPVRISFATAHLYEEADALTEAYVTSGREDFFERATVLRRVAVGRRHMIDLLTAQIVVRDDLRARGGYHRFNLGQAAPIL